MANGPNSFGLIGLMGLIEQELIGLIGLIV